MAGLDGLRGLAVALVVVFHVFPNTLPGGFLGVDVFFVLSGYLITGLLVPRLLGGATRPALRRFWVGRVRRLAPELLAVLFVVCVVAGYAGAEFTAGLRAQVAAAAVSGTNWLLIVHGQNYFAAFAAAAGHPPALQHLWSLAVEEQFYLLWPLLLRTILRTRFPALLTAAGSATAFALMAAQSGAGSADYYSTLTHCGGLLLGAAIALRLPLTRVRRLDSVRDARIVRLIGRCGLGGIVVVLVLAACLSGETTGPERGGIALASVAALAVLLASATRDTDVARMLQWQPIVYLGTRSYGVYLWHWPLIVLLGAPANATGARAATGRAVAELILPVVLAALSHRLATLPARSFDGRALWRRLTGGADATAWRARALTGLAAMALLPAALGLIDAPRIDPQQSALLAQISAGSAVAAASVTDSGPGGAPHPAARAAVKVSPSASAPGLPPDGPPDPVLGQETTVVGDSVLLASAEPLSRRLPGAAIDAKVGRQIYEAPDVLEDLAARGLLRHFVVLALGTNGDTTVETLNRIKRIIGPARVLVLITVHVPDPWQDTVNTLYVDYVVAHRDSMLIDWNATISPHPELLWTDDTHPRPAGADVYANLLADSLAHAPN